MDVSVEMIFIGQSVAAERSIRTEMTVNNDVMRIWEKRIVQQLCDGLSETPGIQCVSLPCTLKITSGYNPIQAEDETIPFRASLAFRRFRYDHVMADVLSSTGSIKYSYVIY